jgi:hypothetical protein
MLQCSNYKAWQARPAATISRSGTREFHPTFTKSPAFAPRPCSTDVIAGMGEYAGARDLRNLLSVAAKLRHLADDALCRGDRSLYLMAAEALETRAQWLAATLPEEKLPVEDESRIHQPVDLII